uniref:Uncharacterized protein n=2 Tax=Meloidogyne TaxID=189290 RepID=A0A6V7VTG3_MELEN|nr:unnamed protein product [Meloidogyne enterolobii]
MSEEMLSSDNHEYSEDFVVSGDIKSESKGKENKKRKVSHLAKESEDAMRKRILKQQIFERQRDLFGVEMPKREYDFSYEMQDKILQSYTKENPNFKESLKYFKKSYRGSVTKEISVIIHDNT